jgi:hypothetical protein
MGLPLISARHPTPGLDGTDHGLAAGVDVQRAAPGLAGFLKARFSRRFGKWRRAEVRPDDMELSLDRIVGERPGWNGDAQKAQETMAGIDRESARRARWAQRMEHVDTFLQPS